MSKNIRDIYGEYDPPLTINPNPTADQKEAAQKIIEKYERLSAGKAKSEKK